MYMYFIYIYTHTLLFAYLFDYLLFTKTDFDFVNRDPSISLKVLRNPKSGSLAGCTWYVSLGGVSA